MLITLKKGGVFLFFLKKWLFLSKFLRQKTQILMNKKSNYQVKLTYNSYLFECDVLTRNKLNNTAIVSQHNGFLYTINTIFN